MARKVREPINIKFAVISIIIAIAIWTYVKSERAAEEKRADQSAYLNGQGDNTHGKNNHTQRTTSPHRE